MIIKGNRRGAAQQLADHLLRRDTNEEVIIRDLGHYPTLKRGDVGLRVALNLMAAQGKAKGKPRNLYHAIIAPQNGEVLDRIQMYQAVDQLARNLGMAGHQRIIVEHRKSGRQHFHVVFNILHPVTGKQARLQWTRRIEWNTARQLESELGLKPVLAKGRSARRWEVERGKRHGIDPLQFRSEVTTIYNTSHNAAEFVKRLNKAGYVLTKGKQGRYVLVDKVGDIHGLLRRIEGVKLKDLRQKFPDLKNQPLQTLEEVIKTRKPVRHNWESQNKRSRKIHAFSQATPFTATHTTTPSLVHQTAKPNHKHTALISLSGAQHWRHVVAAGRAAYAEERSGIMRYVATILLRKEKAVSSEEGRPITGRFNRAELERAELLAWAWENARYDVLRDYGMIIFAEMFDP